MDDPKNHGWYRCELAPGSAILTNESVDRSRFYQETLLVDPNTGAKVKGADLIQPFDPKGTPNLDFIERYGTREYKKEDKEIIKAKYG